MIKATFVVDAASIRHGRSLQVAWDSVWLALLFAPWVALLFYRFFPGTFTGIRADED